MAKKFLLGLVICLWLTIGTHAQAASFGDYGYTESGGEITIIGYTGPGGDIVIPATINDMPVVKIGTWAFDSHANLTSVTIPDSVTSIGFEAFAWCDKLTSVTVGNSVTSIGDSAFYDCSGLATLTLGSSVTSIGRGAFEYCYALTSVTIPDSVTSIGDYAFSCCESLTSLTIGNGVTSIGTEAFYLCTSLTSVTIPDSVTSIGEGAFRGCTALTAIIVNANNLNYSSLDGVLYNKNKTVLIDCPRGISGSVTIPDSVTSIGAAFAGCNKLTSVTIGNGITRIEVGAFNRCSSLTSVTIGNSVTSIGAGAFYYCSSLTSVTIPDSVTSIGVEAFRSCSNLTSVTIGSSVTTIGGAAFRYCSNLAEAIFLGDAPLMGANVFANAAPDFSICYTAEGSGFTSPSWEGYQAAPCACSYDTDCEDYELCKDGKCILPDDDPPTIDAGPYRSDGYWPLLPTDPDSPMILKQDYSVLWIFSDDGASCPGELCTYTAEYQADGDSTWTTLDNDPDLTWAEDGWVSFKLQVADFTNATTYAVRLTVTDCGNQSTQSALHYFRVAASDAPPVLEGGPWLAAGSWPLLSRNASGAFVLSQDYDVLWTFSDDYATCPNGICTNRGRYRKLGDEEWTWLPVVLDSTERWYAYVTLPIASENLAPGTYQFHYYLMDCAQQWTSAPSLYYFKVAE